MKHAFLAAFTLLGAVNSPAQTPAPTGPGAADPYRPAYHFTAPKNWLNDANGLIFSNGQYQLFYQYNPYSADPGHLSWGHATSPDLVRWTPQPVALTEYKNADGSNTMIFSGSAVADKDNTSGLFPKGQTDGLVAFYTGHVERPGVVLAQHQNLAFSLDHGRTWQRYAGNPVLDIGSKEFRDPKVFWYAPQQKWVMATVKADRQLVYLYESKNLKDWTFMSRWGQAGNTVREWECPDLFELPVPGGGTRWVLLISAGNPTEEFRGQQYFLGQFDGKAFTPDQAYDEPTYLDFGKDFFAGVTFNDAPGGRRILVGWTNNWAYARDVPTGPAWRGSFAVPRELSLRRTPQGLVLNQLPVPELRQRGKQALSVPKLTLKPGPAGYEVPFRGEAYEVELTLTPGTAKTVTLNVLQSEAECTALRYDVARQELTLDRTQSGNVGFNPLFASTVETVRVPLQNGQLQLRVLVDKSVVEVFAQNGEVTLTDLVFPRQHAGRLTLHADGGPAQVSGLRLTDLSAAARL
ncbi:glycoside hydrolase family 32 protein [Hymenobacter sp. H14-R3]|uniref:glycoside hydrolase family 32 protein n=1 Tax=Hymenobacter sp. H14-R3 TaxID=3046308 RepID=UPI0024BA66C8|nr:glycoside hydrolase family 32 protein [Hymenobacter sp. H14-R3]MDJ0365854.1 glycoside hydrolase family 32 protein [Hymenobacter sp. H14-R3]